MCGIAGIFSLEPTRPIAVERTQRALRELALRGPDDVGHFSAPGIWLGHRRLAILDPLNGRQPWVDAETRQVLVYNGELYNFRELAETFPDSERTSFRSTGDTAVLSALLRREGPEGIAQARGMFAFAWYDPGQERLVLARDRLGVKPLYYSWREGVLSFASSIPALLALTGEKPRADGVALTHYLATARTSFGARTLFEGIYSLEAGTCLYLSRKSRAAPECRRYWSVPAIPETEKNAGSWKGGLEECRRAVTSAVREQMVSDVPLGAFLSGGLDSSIIASAIPDSALGGLFTFNVGYEQASYNEWEQARELAEARGIHCTHVPLGSNDEWSDLRDLIRLKGSPLSTPNEIAIWKLSRAFAKRGKVALTGEGADEIFGGYALPTLGALDFERSKAPGVTPQTKAALSTFYGRAQFDSRADHFLALNSWTRLVKRNQWLRPEWVDHWQAEALIRSHYEDRFAPLQACSTLEAYLHLHVQVNLEGLLSRVDTSTMAASVEARVPFTDHRLVEWAFQIPDHWKIALACPPETVVPEAEIAVDWMQSGRIATKRVLREAFRPAIPASICDRPKMSFPSPFVESLNGPWKVQTEGLLRDSRFLRERLAVPPQLLFGEGIALWLWTNIALWAEVWDVS